MTCTLLGRWPLQCRMRLDSLAAAQALLLEVPGLPALQLLAKLQGCQMALLRSRSRVLQYAYAVVKEDGLSRQSPRLLALAALGRPGLRHTVNDGSFRRRHGSSSNRL
uniref:Uncharacterized protein n=1 Tax=Ananas comosus var. bracteatus TaxID=296719 RepID=A0A6V7NVY0_ANACO|nr:unnamed protein product [Ananas comosus var. bracteatus]